MPVTEEFLSRLPTSPGVYIMLDSRGKTLYVGKASNLKNRVRSYFVEGRDERPTVRYLMERVDEIRTLITDTEKEALILENNLIKQRKPKYNVDLRDDKSFFSLRLNVSHPFPKLSLIRTQKITSDGERYFGPYSSARDARITLKTILRLFPLRQCTDKQMSTCVRPCLNCQMKRCLCPCTGKVDIDEYARMVNAIALLLQGRSDDMLMGLRRDMEEAALDLRFEEAARIRDRIATVERTLEAQNVSFFHLKDQDVFAVISGDNNLFIVQALSFRRGNLLSGESFVIRNPALEPEQVLSEALKRYYADGVFVPKEALTSLPLEQTDVIEAWLSELRGNKVTIRAPVKGAGFKLMQLALKNAHDALTREKHRESVEGILERITARLGLPKLPQLIEGYDISNIAGADPVGVKVSFRDGRPEKSGYRKFKIRGYENQDDPGMIHQTVMRRVAHRDEDPLPDLFLIDGGKSQLNAAVAALRESLGDAMPPVASIAKMREERDEERFFIPNRKNEIVFPRGDPGLMLLMRVRDEAHRFAHGFQRKTHTEKVIRSSLDDIRGIGPRKREALLTMFGSVKNVIAASDEELVRAPGINAKDVEKIRAALGRPAAVPPAESETM